MNTEQGPEETMNSEQVQGQSLKMNHFGSLSHQ